jgi:hypothetical protein
MYCNCQYEPAPVFAPGDRVWLNGSDIATNWPSSHHQLGPFTMEASQGESEVNI